MAISHSDYIKLLEDEVALIKNVKVKHVNTDEVEKMNRMIEILRNNPVALEIQCNAINKVIDANPGCSIHAAKTISMFLTVSKSDTEALQDTLDDINKLSDNPSIAFSIESKIGVRISIPFGKHDTTCSESLNLSNPSIYQRFFLIPASPILSIG